jgi:hypothetical protein
LKVSKNLFKNEANEGFGCFLKCSNPVPKKSVNFEELLESQICPNLQNTPEPPESTDMFDNWEVESGKFWFFF